MNTQDKLIKLVNFYIKKDMLPGLYGITSIILFYIVNLSFIKNSQPNEVNQIYVWFSISSFIEIFSAAGLLNLFYYKGKNLKNFFLINKLRLSLILSFILSGIISQFIDESRIGIILLLIFYTLTSRIFNTLFVYSTIKKSSIYNYKFFYLYKTIFLFFLYYFLGFFFSAKLAFLSSIIFSNIFIITLFLGSKTLLIFKFNKIKFKDILFLNNNKMLLQSFLASILQALVGSYLFVINIFYNNSQNIYLFIVCLRILSPLTSLQSYIHNSNMKAMVSKSLNFKKLIYQYLFYSISFLIIIFAYLIYTDYLRKIDYVNYELLIITCIMIYIAQCMDTLSGWLSTNILVNKKININFYLTICSCIFFVFICFLLYFTQFYFLLFLLVMSTSIIRIIWFVLNLKSITIKN